jgi:membrane-bound serine protease (ClpP class)
LRLAWLSIRRGVALAERCYDRRMTVRRSHRAWLNVVLAGVSLAAAGAVAQSGPSASPPTGVLVPVSGPIGPATSDFFVRALDQANAAQASIVVVTLDTPGGLDTSMRDMV